MSSVNHKFNFQSVLFRLVTQSAEFLISFRIRCSQSKCASANKTSNAFTKIMIIPIIGPSGEVDEWLLLELQGDIISKTGEPLTGKDLGDLHFSKQGDPIFIIGHHVLSGKLLNLEKPLIVTKKKLDSENLEYEVVAVIRRKLLFKTRPKPIILSVNKKV